LVPVAYSIAKTFPEDNFYVLTNRSYQTLFQLDAPNLIPIGISTSEYKGVGGLFRLAEDLKKYNLDKIVDVHDVFRTRFLQFYFRLSGKEVVCIDKGRKERSDVISHKVQLKPLRHTMDRYRDTLAEVGYKADNKFSNYTKHSISSISLPKEFSVSPDTKNIGIAPFAKHETKTEPPVWRKIKSLDEALFFVPRVTMPGVFLLPR
jgi:ADP-heptose:LPS heptosyltransferase